MTSLGFDRPQRTSAGKDAPPKGVSLDQLSMFDAPTNHREKPHMSEGARLRDEAIEKVGDNAPPTWMRAALAAIQHVATRESRLTTDDVWARMESVLGSDAAPPEPRAMGAAIMEAKRRGWIHATSQVTPSGRPENHRRPIRIWESLIYVPF